MKNSIQLLFTLILFFAFTTVKAQNAFPASSKKTEAPIIKPHATTDVKKTDVLLMSGASTQGQITPNANTNSKTVKNFGAESVLTSEQKKQGDGSNVETNGKKKETIKNNRGTFIAGAGSV